MYLKELHVHGFKSFYNKTHVEFSPGITSIVGPNGCGKSNVIDAVRWVLGEQRARILRSEKMDNVIFNGTQSRKALGLAEVSLVIENTKNVLPTEYTEVTVTRRLYRSGESEYLLNNVPCRLKDIVDLFMDTGMGAGAYSVIELKMVEEILSENADERRRLFEEAAGITKYKIRRKQALSKLESTRQDLTRVKDITEELEKRVRSLANQAAKARRFKEYQERLVFLEQQLLERERQQLEAQLHALDTELNKLQSGRSAQDAQVALQEAELEQKRVDLIGKEQILAEKQQDLNAFLEASRKVETDLRLSIERQQSAQHNLLRLQREADDTERRKGQLLTQQATLTQQIEQIEVELSERKTETSQLKARQEETRLEADEARKHFQESDQTERQNTRLLNEKRNASERIKQKIELYEIEKVRLEREKSEGVDGAERNEALAHLANAIQEAQNQTQQHKDTLLETENRLAHLNQSLAQLNEQLRDAERKKEAAITESKLLESLVSSYEEFSDTIQYLVKNATWSKSKPQTVADVLNVSGDLHDALEAGLGDLAACFVVQDLQEAQTAIQQLEQSQKGQASFFLLNRIPEVTVKKGSLAEVVETETSFRPLANLLLGNVLLAENLAEAEKQATNLHSKFVTKSGAWADGRGLLFGGSAKKTKTIEARTQRRQQLEAVLQVRADYSAQVEQLLSQIQELRNAIQQIELAPLKQNAEQGQRKVQDLEKQRAQLAYEAQVIQKRQSELQNRLGEINQYLFDDKSQVEVLHHEVQAAEEAHKLADAAKQRAEIKVRETELLAREASTTFNEANIRYIQQQNALQNTRQEAQRLTDELHRLDKRVGFRAQELEQQNTALVAAEVQQSQLKSQIETRNHEQHALQEAVQSIQTAVMQQRATISEAENQLRTTRSERDAAMRQETQLAVQQASTSTKLEEIWGRIREQFPEDETDFHIELLADFDEGGAKPEVEELKRKIKGLGAVNALALEAYEEEKERLDFQTEQQKDLEVAESLLLETILEINQTAARKFDETFSQINTYFTQLFAKLFNEGDTAQLLMTSEDPLEAQIQIIAKPRGKKPSSISQLSGGEKTLTAIALLFAIYLVKPSPFCILDEVDAPLDDANVGRFMELIRSFADSTQFILVTHNKLTMEAADRMYGITMAEQGVSQVVGVSFDKVEA